MNTQIISRRDFLKNCSRKFIDNLQAISNNALSGYFPKSDSAEKQKYADTKSKKAFVDVNRCLAWEGVSCQYCYLACPLREKAIIMSDLKPVIDTAFCDGCAMCLAACRTVNDLPAIKMIPR